MTTIQMKKRIKNYIDQADDRMLRILNAMVESEEQQIPPELKQELDKRLELHNQNPEQGKKWEELKTELKAKYAL